MKKINALLVLALVPFLLISGCTKKKLDKDTLYYNLSTEPPTLDPNLATDTTSSTVIRNLFDGLMDYDISKPDMPVVPKVAKSWKATKGGKVYTFTLRDDVYWSDGKKVTAYDFAYSWQRLLTPTTASEYAYFLFDILNAKEFNSGKLKDFSKVGIKALNPTTFQLTLKAPVAYFIHVAVFSVLSPLRKDIIAKYGDAWTEPQNIVTNGPFTLEKWKHDYELVLVRNENYYTTKSKLKRVHCYMVTEQSTSLSLFQTGKIDLIKEVPAPDIPRLKNSPNFHTGNFFGVYYIGLNTQKAPLDNAYVRQALNAAVDRREVIIAVGDSGQLPAKSFIPNNMLGFSDSIGIGFNKERAQALMVKAGYIQKKVGKSLVWIHKKTKKPFPTIAYTYNTNEGHKTLAENLQSQWKRNLGINVELYNQEWKVYLKTLQTADKNLKKAPFHIYRMGWVGDYPDPDNFMAIFTSYSEQNHTGWKSKEYDRYIEKAKVTLNPKKRKPLYDKAQKLLLEKTSAIIPVYVYSFKYMWKPESLKGIYLNSLDHLHFDRMWIAKR